METIAAKRAQELEQGYQGASELFLMRCRSLGLSPATIRWYGMILDGLRAFLESLPDRPLPRNTRPPHIRAYLDHIRGRGFAPGTVKRFCVGLGRFFRFLAEERVIAASPMTFVEIPRMPKVLVRPLTSEEVMAVLAKPNTRTFRGVRDFALLALALDSGLRLSEIIGIKPSDLDLAQGSVRVMGKGSRERIAYFGQAARRALMVYRERRGDPSGAEYFFISQFGEKLKARWVQQVVARYGKAAGVEGLHPHRLRHTFAVSFLRAGGNAMVLQRLLGHSSLEMTRRYCELSDDDTMSAFRLASPLDRLGPLPNERKQVRLK
jgi:site-specific recombinase XerD